MGAAANQALWRYIRPTDPAVTIPVSLAAAILTTTDLTKINGTTLTGRDISLDLKALTDNSITGILKSLQEYLKCFNDATATQVVKSTLMTAGTITILHTVTALKTLHLKKLVIGMWGTTSGATCSIKVRNVGDTNQYTIAALKTGTTADGKTVPINFDMPIKIPAGYDIISDCNDYASGETFIHGWEE